MYLEIRGEMDVFVGILSQAGKTSVIPRFEKKIIVSVEKQMKVSALKRIIQHREKVKVELIGMSDADINSGTSWNIATATNLQHFVKEICVAISLQRTLVSTPC